MSDNIGMPENNGGRVVREITISKLAINVFAVFATLIFFALFIAAWKIFRGIPYKAGLLKQTYLYIILSFPIHELIHALGFRFFGKAPWSKIKFGFVVKLLAPYANPMIPLSKTAYLWSGALPGLTIGIVPLLLGFILGSMPLSFVGLISVMASMGDLFILWTLRGVASNQSVLEHADQCHFSIMEKS
jgi:hypothetical protein